MKKILVVDDEPEQTEILASYIEDADIFECKTCYSGKSALALLEKEHFDCIFLDLVMPEIGGVQVLKELK